MKKNNTNTKKRKNGMRTDGFCLAALVHNLKKLFIPWLILAVLAAGTIISSNYLFSTKVDALSSTVSFYFNGIEDGLDPNGCEFDKNSIKDDAVIASALEEMNLSAELLTTVQNGIYVDSIVSTSSINEITQYNSIYDSSDTEWIESMKDSSYHPTQYRVSFNYNKTSLSGDEAAKLLNLILEKYQLSFFETYGYNESIGNSILEFSFDDYDYLIALDMYSSKIASLKSYVDTIAKNNSTQFRSEVTGYNFSDLSDSLNLIRSIDIDSLTSYILNNGVISDKDMIVSYYEFRLNSLKRSKSNYKARLDSVVESIEQYQKDAVIVYESADTASSMTVTSEIYDDLIQRKISLQNTVSYYDNQISDINERISSINKASVSSSKLNVEYVDKQLTALNEKVCTLVENIRLTADDYYETEKFMNAVSVTSPAEYSFVQYLKSVLSESIRLIIIAELSLITIYLFAAIAVCFRSKFNSFRKLREKV